MNARHLRAHEARLNITWQGQNADLPDPVPFDATDRQLKQWAAEAIAHGSVPGIRNHGRLNVRDFVVDRFPANNQTPYARIFIRPKTPFG
ncbi:MAG: hypothetical protein AAFV53_42870 [Myxococcota bacterium]